MATLLLLSFAFLEKPIDWYKALKSYQFLFPHLPSLTSSDLLTLRLEYMHQNALFVKLSYLTVLSTTSECRECRQSAVFSNVKISTEWSTGSWVVGSTLPSHLLSLHESHWNESWGREGDGWRMISKKRKKSMLVVENRKSSRSMSKIMENFWNM